MLLNKVFLKFKRVIVENIKNFRIIPVLVVIFLIILPITWFKEKGSFLLIGDQTLPFSINEIFKTNLFIWNEGLLGFDSNFLIAQFFPHNFLFLLLYKIGFSIRTSEIILFSLFFVLSFIFAYLLFKKILYFYSNKIFKKENVLIATLGAFLYSFNLYLVIMWHGGAFSGLIFPYALAPLFLQLLFEISFEEKKDIKIYGLLLGLLSALALSSTLPYVVAAFIMPVTIFVLLVLIFSKSKYKKRLLKTILISIFIALIVNLWWILPMAQSILQSPTFVSSNSNLVTYIGATQDLWGTLKLHLSWAWNDGWSGRKFFSFADSYKNLELEIIWITILTICSLSIFAFSKYKMRLITAFGFALFFISTFLAKGTKPPGGNIFEFIYLHIPGFSMFRTPDTKFGAGIVLGLSILLTVSIYIIFSYIKDHKLQLLIFGFVFSLILLYSWPFITGIAVIEKQQGFMGNHFVNVPDFYLKTIDRLNNDKELFRIIMIPGYSSALRRWDNKIKSGPDILEKSLNNPIVFDAPDEANITNISSNTFKSISKIEKDYDFKDLIFSNAKYIILRKDLIWENYKLPSPDEIREKYINFCINNEIISSLEICEVNKKYYLPKIFTNRSEKEDINNPNEFYSKIIKNKNKPTITFQKINSTKYNIKIENATQKFIIYFLDNFNDQWQIYLESKPRKYGQIIKNRELLNVREAKYNLNEITFLDIFYSFKKPIFNESHKLALKYANAWEIDPAKIGKNDFEITLLYKPQILFYYSIIISVLTFIITFIGLIWLTLKNLRNKS